MMGFQGPRIAGEKPEINRVRQTRDLADVLESEQTSTCQLI
jgi:hypothetical protein